MSSQEIRDRHNQAIGVLREKNHRLHLERELWVSTLHTVLGRDNAPNVDIAAVIADKALVEFKARFPE